MSTNNTYKPSYDQAMEELTQLRNELESIEKRREDAKKRMSELKQVILALAPLCDETPWEDYPDIFPEVGGLSNATKQVLRQPPVGGAWIDPGEVRNRLGNFGYEIKSKNILPSVHNVLKRLVAAGEVEVKPQGLRKIYRWKPKPGAVEANSKNSGLKERKKPSGKRKKQS